MRNNWIAVASAGHARRPYAFDMGGGFAPFRRDMAYMCPRKRCQSSHCWTSLSLWKTVAAGAASSVLVCSR